MTSTEKTALTPDRAQELGRTAYSPDRFTPSRGLSAGVAPPELRYAIADQPAGTAIDFAALMAAFCQGWEDAAQTDQDRRTAAAAVERATTTLRIVHTAADGTLLEGSSKGDGVWEIVRGLRSATKTWRYFRSIRAIGVNNSRDKPPTLHLIDRTAEVLREAGWTVEVEVDGTPRAFDVQEDDRADRMDDRAAALHGKAARRDDEATTRYAASRALLDGIPTGQPVLVGHHSEKGHRRALRNADGHMRRSVEAAKEALRAADAAQAAERHMQVRTNPRRVYRRVEKLEADLRSAERALAGHTRRFLDNNGEPWMIHEIPAADGRDREQLELNVAHLEVQITGWRAALDQAAQQGGWQPIDLSAVQKGHWIGSWAGWREVASVNRRSVSVWDTHANQNGPAPDGDRFRRVIKLDQITGHRTASPFEEPDPVEVAADLDTPCPAEPVGTDQAAPPSARHPSGLSDAAIEVLTAAGATERSVHLAGIPEDRAVFGEVDTWLSERSGFQAYSIRERAYLYRTDPRGFLLHLTGHAPVRPASGSHDKALSYFATPTEVATLMAAQLGPDAMRVLEPSAGDGALVAAVLAAHPQAVVQAVETDPGRVAILRRRFGSAWHGTFQDYVDHARMSGQFEPFDAVVMNPPFTEPGHRYAWATHFELAWSLLRPGGRMVAILPNSFRFAGHRYGQAVRALVDGSDGVVTDLPDSTFADVGTRARTVLVSATRS